LACVKQNDLRVRNPVHREAVPATAYGVDMTTLREQMIQDMTLRGLSEKTQEAYLRTVSRLSEFYWRPPDRISDREAQSYRLHLHRERQFSHSTCNVAVSGLRFFYHVTLRRPNTSFVMPSPRIYSKPASTCTPFSDCSGTRASAPPRATCT